MQRNSSTEKGYDALHRKSNYTPISAKNPLLNTLQGVLSLNFIQPVKYVAKQKNERDVNVEDVLI